MEIKASSYEKIIGLESELKELSNTSFKFYNLGDLHRRLNSQPIHPITQELKDSGLVEDSRFPMVLNELELV